MPPFAGPQAVLAYLARYTHRAAIANSRLMTLDERGVTFGYKDYRRNGQARYRTMTLAADEFIRRFLLHVLPKRFHRIRHYGLLASPGSKANIARAKELIAALNAAGRSARRRTTQPIRMLRPIIARRARRCGGRMIIVEVFGRGGAPRGPPSSGAAEREFERDDYHWSSPGSNPFAGTARSRRRAGFSPGIGKCRQDIIDQSPIRPSATLAGPGPQSSAALSSHQPAQNHPPPTPLPDQFPIDGQLLAAVPRVRFSEAFGRRPSALARVDC